MNVEERYESEWYECGITCEELSVSANPPRLSEESDTRKTVIRITSVISFHIPNLANLPQSRTYSHSKPDVYKSGYI
jgi:hypothetical protein